jgi:hypothetical protein
MWLYIAFISLFLGLCCLVIFQWQRQKKTNAAIKRQLQNQTVCLEQKDVILQEKMIELHKKEDQLLECRRETARVEAKYQKKVLSLEERKANLEKYHKTHQAVRRGLKETLENAIENQEKWVAHARVTPSKGKLGKRKGGRGGGRKRPSFLHKAIHLIPEKCPHCGRDLSDRTACLSHTHVITDLENLQGSGHEYKALTLLNTVLVIYRRRCIQCHRWIVADSGPLKYLRYGLNFVVYVISKRIDTRMPFAILIDDLITQFGSALNLSATAIIDWFKRHEPLLVELYTQMKKIVDLLNHVHVDETGLPMNGKNWWTWIICNEYFVWYWQSHTRGHQAIDQILSDFEGVIVSDCWGAYNKLDKEQQKCLAHLITGLKEILYRVEKETSTIEKDLSDQKELQAATSASVTNLPDSHNLPTLPAPRKQGRPKKQVEILPRTEVTHLQEAIHIKGNTLDQAKRLKDFLDASWEAGPRGWKTPLDQRCSKQEAEQQLLTLIQTLRKEGVNDDRLRKVIDRSEKFANKLFTYLDHEGIEPDNNEAERDLRGMVVQRKVSGSYKSPQVSEVFHLLKSLSVTCRKNKKDFQALHQRLLEGEKVDLATYFFPVQEENLGF